MIRVLASDSAPGPALADGFGRRVRSIDPDVGDEVELLELAPALVEHDGFVTALGDRVARVSSVRHASYVHLRRLDRPAADRLSLVSDYTPGWRLSELLRVGTETNTALETTGVIGLLRQLLPAVSLFSRHNRESAISALAPERLIVTPQARLVIPEHAFGSALEKLNLGRDRCWRDFRIAMPPSAGLPRANARADANALGVVALSLLLGRLLNEGEYPGALQGLIESATERRDGESVPLSPPLSQWLTRAMQFDARHSFQTPHEAQVAFEAVLASNRGYVTGSGALEKWVTAVGAAIEHANTPPPPPEPESEPTPIVVVMPAPADAPEASSASASAREQSGELRRDFAEAASGREGEPQAPGFSPLVLTLLAIVGMMAITVAWLWLRPAAGSLGGDGELVVQSRPSGKFSIDGKPRGVTPQTIRLSAGAHVLEVQIGDSEPRVIPLTIRAGVQTSQYVELQNVPTAGGLDVQSQPVGARVSVDGKPYGTAPASIKNLPVGDHEVVLELKGRKVKQVVRIEAGITAQLVVPIPRK